LAREKGLAAETLPIAHMRPVIVVNASSDAKINSLDELLAGDYAIAMANPDEAAIGRSVRDQLRALPAGKETMWDRLERQVTKRGVFKMTVSDVANDVKIGAVDAGIVWDSTVAMPKYRAHLKAVPSPELAGDPSLVEIAVLHSSKNATGALRFARYLTARDKGLPIFAEYGFRPVEGDVWAVRPEITFFLGAVNRRAVEPIIEAFQAREGCVVNTVPDGCGILTDRMKMIADQKTESGFPDVYLACDLYYLENVKQWFQEAVNVSDVDIVIAVPKGSTTVKSLADLIKPGVRVSIGEPASCTIGALTRRLLQREGLYDDLLAKQRDDHELVVEKTSSALIVPDVAAGHVDAGVAYMTDVLANRSKVDFVRIESSLAVAVQPFSIAMTSDHKYLVRRLFRAIAAAPEAFADLGFRPRLGQPAEAGTAGP
jgi:ABC-type molybdate transport system substrate-binding protein